MTTIGPGDAAAAFARQGDWARVVPEARKALANDPESAMMNALLALGLAHQNESRAAVDAGRRSVALDPELALAHRALGWALFEDGDAKGAERSAREALRLDEDSGAYALLAQVLVKQRRWRDALDAAGRGLAIDPEDTDCTNLRALALASLGRSEEAERASDEALALDPEDAGSHANRGWLLLRQSRIDEALESFRIALRIDPSLEWARLGIVEALKAKNGLYRAMLKYSLWMGTLQGRTQWMIIIGLYVIARAARGFLRTHPEWMPVLGPLLVLYALFVLTTWIADPLSNLILRLHPFGRLALTKAETLGANLVGACLATAVVSGLAFWVTGSTGWAFLGGVSVVLLIPVGGAFAGHGTRAWPFLRNALIVLAAFGATGVVMSFLGLEAAVVPVAVMGIGAFLFGWVASYLIMKYE